jgi:hypothetical protein
MCVGNAANRLNTHLDALARNQRTDHQHYEAILRNSELRSVRRAWPESITINAIGNEAAVPVVFVSFEEIRIDAN